MFEIYLLRAMSVTIFAFLVWMTRRAIEGRKFEQDTALAQEVRIAANRKNLHQNASRRLQAMRHANDDARFDRVLQDINWPGPREVVTK